MSIVHEAGMRLILLLLSVSLVQVHSLTDPRVPQMFFPFGHDQGDSVVPVQDDVSSPAIRISTSFPFLSGNYSTVYVSIACSFKSFTYISSSSSSSSSSTNFIATQVLNKTSLSCTFTVWLTLTLLYVVLRQCLKLFIENKHTGKLTDVVV